MGTPDEDAERKSKQIEELSKDLLKEYDELQKQHEQTKAENESLKRQLVEKDKTLQDAKNLIEPAIQQYERLKNKYKIEKECRDKAQTYATKIYQHHNKLKRQSMDLIGLLDKQQIPITELQLGLDEEDELEEEVRGGYDSVLNQEIKEFKNQVADLQVQLHLSQSELQSEREAHQWDLERFSNMKVQLRQTEAQLEEYRKQLSEFTQDAEENYSNLQEMFREEQERRDIAERKMAELTVSENKMKRQSNALMLKVTPGEQLHKALMEIEDLTQTLEQQRNFYDEQIEQLKSQLGQSSSEETELIETELNSIKEEREDLVKRLEDFDKKYSTLEKQYSELQEKYEKLKCPPPPPPPPPPPLVPKSGGFLRKKKKKTEDATTTLSKSGTAPHPDFNKALDEMMENIKKGRTLKPTMVQPVQKETDVESSGSFRTILKSRSCDVADQTKETDAESSETFGRVLKSRSFDTAEQLKKDPVGNPMNELQNIMNKMKRNPSVGSAGSENSVSTVKSSTDSELARTFMKVRNKSIDKDPIPLRDPGKLTKVAEESESDILTKGPEVYESVKL